MLHQSTRPGDSNLSFHGIVGRCESMRRVFQQLERVARTDSTVLICGESGTGKELVAGALHRLSPRRNGPYVAVNVAAVPDNLIESELFGHVKGAFTDAAADRQGRFEAADSGTLFIDEIGDLKLPSQAKLLRVLESRQVTPVGGNRSRSVNLRVIAATNRRLDELVAEKKFREDLYYRLNVITLLLPPLRERPEDIPLLVDHFLDEVCRKCARPRPQFDPELQQFMETYSWPGNVRQLRNCVESMVVLADSEVLTPAHLPAMVRRHPSESSDFEVPPGVTLDELERAAVLQRLRTFRGNRTQAAESLDISVRTLQRRLRRWGLVRGRSNGNGVSASSTREREEVLAEAH